jgi:orotidine-5'-phosphate decarboxylase
MTTVVKRPSATTFIPDNPVCVALDAGERGEIDRLVAATESSVGLFKVGLTSFIAHGAELVKSVSSHRPVFLDLKLHDIPQQVSGAVREAGATGAAFVTVHASGGSDMVRAASESAPPGMAVLAVTVLTSLDDASLDELGLRGPSEAAVLRLAETALAGGADGIVCSPLEVSAVRSRFGTADAGGPVLVVPGIRPVGASVGDQKRTLGPGEAIDAGADVIVVGRPITAADDPAAAAAAIAGSLS